jgi:hypothetical protein
MKALILTPLAALLLTGCLVQTRERTRSSKSVRKSCPPAHHWENGACVHNGKAKGHYKK